MPEKKVFDLGDLMASMEIVRTSGFKPKLIRPWKSSKSKYGAIKSEQDGVVFDSKMEVEYFNHVNKSRAEKDRLIPHPTKIIFLEGCDSQGRRIVIDWKPDFYDPIRDIYIDTKGSQTQRFRLLKKIIKMQRKYKVVVVTRAPGLSSPWSEESL